MRFIDVETWPRGEHYRFYRQLDNPHFSMCANVDLTAFHPALKARGVGFTVGILYVLTRAANDVPEFRCRMRGDEVVEYEIVHPGATILADDDTFGFCTINFVADFALFEAGAIETINSVKRQPTLIEEPRDDVLYTTSIPWVSFTSFAHPTHLHPVDSIPRMAWGKRFEDNGRLKMPLSVQGHHAMMDGLHMGRYYERVQAYLSEPAQFLGIGADEDRSRP
jgi:chloramphenicol O-acetyltransferase type A